jgi:hypothetical protein
MVQANIPTQFNCSRLNANLFDLNKLAALCSFEFLQQVSVTPSEVIPKIINELNNLKESNIIRTQTCTFANDLAHKTAIPLRSLIKQELMQISNVEQYMRFVLNGIRIVLQTICQLELGVQIQGALTPYVDYFVPYLGKLQQMMWPMSGGKSVEYVTILGRRRKVVLIGRRVKHVNVKGRLIPLKEARRLESAALQGIR